MNAPPPRRRSSSPNNKRSRQASPSRSPSSKATSTTSTKNSDCDKNKNSNHHKQEMTVECDSPTTTKKEQPQTDSADTKDRSLSLPPRSPKDKSFSKHTTTATTKLANAKSESSAERAARNGSKHIKSKKRNIRKKDDANQDNSPPPPPTPSTRKVNFKLPTDPSLNSDSDNDKNKSGDGDSRTLATAPAKLTASSSEQPPSSQSPSQSPQQAPPRPTSILRKVDSFTNAATSPTTRKGSAEYMPPNYSYWNPHTVHHNTHANAQPQSPIWATTGTRRGRGDTGSVGSRRSHSSGRWSHASEPIIHVYLPNNHSPIRSTLMGARAMDGLPVAPAAAPRRTSSPSRLTRRSPSPRRSIPSSNNNKTKPNNNNSSSNNSKSTKDRDCVVICTPSSDDSSEDASPTSSQARHSKRLAASSSPSKRAATTKVETDSKEQQGPNFKTEKSNMDKKSLQQPKRPTNHTPTRGRTNTRSGGPNTKSKWDDKHCMLLFDDSASSSFEDCLIPFRSIKDKTAAASATNEAEITKSFSMDYQTHLTAKTNSSHHHLHPKSKTSSTRKMSTTRGRSTSPNRTRRGRSASPYISRAGTKNRKNPYVSVPDHQGDTEVNKNPNVHKGSSGGGGGGDDDDDEVIDDSKTRIAVTGKKHQRTMSPLRSLRLFGSGAAGRNSSLEDEKKGKEISVPNVTQKEALDDNKTTSSQSSNEAEKHGDDDEAASDCDTKQGSHDKNKNNKGDNKEEYEPQTDKNTNTISQENTLASSASPFSFSSFFNSLMMTPYKTDQHTNETTEPADGTKNEADDGRDDSKRSDEEGNQEKYEWEVQIHDFLTPAVCCSATKHNVGEEETLAAEDEAITAIEPDSVANDESPECDEKEDNTEKIDGNKVLQPEETTQIEVSDTFATATDGVNDETGKKVSLFSSTKRLPTKKASWWKRMSFKNNSSLLLAPSSNVSVISDSNYDDRDEEDGRDAKESPPSTCGQGEKQKSRSKGKKDGASDSVSTTSGNIHKRESGDRQKDEPPPEQNEEKQTSNMDEEPYKAKTNSKAEKKNVDTATPSSICNSEISESETVELSRDQVDKAVRITSETLNNLQEEGAHFGDHEHDSFEGSRVDSFTDQFSTMAQISKMVTSIFGNASGAKTEERSNDQSRQHVSEPSKGNVDTESNKDTNLPLQEEQPSETRDNITADLTRDSNTADWSEEKAFDLSAHANEAVISNSPDKASTKRKYIFNIKGGDSREKTDIDSAESDTKAKEKPSKKAVVAGWFSRKKKASDLLQSDQQNDKQEKELQPGNVDDKKNDSERMKSGLAADKSTRKTEKESLETKEMATTRRSGKRSSSERTKSRSPSRSRHLQAEDRDDHVSRRRYDPFEASVRGSTRECAGDTSQCDGKLLLKIAKKRADESGILDILFPPFETELPDDDEISAAASAKTSISMDSLYNPLFRTVPTSMSQSRNRLYGPLTTLKGKSPLLIKAKPEVVNVANM
ncbi:hypothetical protein ACA910_001152 [Epithemia clementina (nom. ined.)]